MKRLMIALAVAVFSFGVGVGDAEAKRLGGGKSIGTQRNVSPAPAAAPGQAAAAKPGAPAAAAPAAAQPKRNWMGPLAGLAAGLGIAALLSHFGLGEGMADFFMILLLAGAAFFVFRMLFRKKAAPTPEPMQYAGVGGPGMAPPPPVTDLPGSSASTAAAGASSAFDAGTAARPIPADFDSEGFVRIAKLNFIRLQAANDSGNLDDLREFLAPELFAEVQMQMAERGNTPQQTDVVTLNADLLEVVTEGGKHIASVRFHGMLREEANAPAAAFDEVWNLIKPVEGQRGWMVAGIQQLQ